MYDGKLRGRGFLATSLAPMFATNTMSSLPVTKVYIEINIDGKSGDFCLVKELQHGCTIRSDWLGAPLHARWLVVRAFQRNTAKLGQM